MAIIKRDSLVITLPREFFSYKTRPSSGGPVDLMNKDAAYDQSRSLAVVMDPRTNTSVLLDLSAFFSPAAVSGCCWPWLSYLELGPSGETACGFGGGRPMPVTMPEIVRGQPEYHHVRQQLGRLGEVHSVCCLCPSDGVFHVSVDTLRESVEFIFGRNDMFETSYDLMTFIKFVQQPSAGQTKEKLFQKVLDQSLCDDLILVTATDRARAHAVLQQVSSSF